LLIKYKLIIINNINNRYLLISIGIDVREQYLLIIIMIAIPRSNDFTESIFFSDIKIELDEPITNVKIVTKISENIMDIFLPLINL